MRPEKSGIRRDFPVIRPVKTVLIPVKALIIKKEAVGLPLFPLSRQIYGPSRQDQKTKAGRRPQKGLKKVIFRFIVVFTDFFVYICIHDITPCVKRLSGLNAPP